MSKYHAVRVMLDGITFDSKREAARYGELKLLEAAGEITSLEIHPRYKLLDADPYMMQRATYYIGDFQYIENGKVVCEDVKGVETAVFKLKAKLFRMYYPDYELRIVK